MFQISLSENSAIESNPIFKTLASGFERKKGKSSLQFLPPDADEILFERETVRAKTLREQTLQIAEVAAFVLTFLLVIACSCAVVFGLLETFRVVHEINTNPGIHALFLSEM